jgi:hypothetical protein
MFGVRREQGRPQELLPLLGHVAGGHPQHRRQPTSQQPDDDGVGQRNAKPLAKATPGDPTTRVVVKEAGRAYGPGVAVDVLTETVIECPRDEVAHYAADPSNAPGWYENIRSVTWRTPPPLGVGSEVDFEARFLGRRLAYTYEVVEHVLGQRLVMRTADGPFPMETTYTWESLGPTTTRMTLRNRGEPSGFGAIAAPALQAAMRRANRKDLDRIRAVLEA